MTQRDQSVKTYSGTPPATAFGASQGTPLVIDYAAATGYFMHPVTGAVTALGGGGGGSGTVTSVGVSTPNSTLSLGGTNPVTTTGTISADINLGHANHWTAVQGSTYEVLTDAATITPAGSTNVSYLLCTNAVGATRTINVPTFTNGTSSDYWACEVEQPSSGGPCAVVFASGFKWGSGGLDAQPVGTSTNGAVDSYFFQKQHNGDWHGNMIGQAGPTGAGYQATSTTSLVTAGSGSKAFTTQLGLAYSIGARIRATSRGTAEYMEGIVSSYSGGVLTATMDTNSGTGTHTDWNINLAGNVGGPGSAGSSNFAGTSATSQTIGAGSLVFTTQAGLAYAVGSRVRFANSAAPANYLEGVITAYSGTSITVLSDATGGSGTVASWNLTIAGQPGATGATGASGVRIASFTTNGSTATNTSSTTFANIASVTASIAAAVGDNLVIEFSGACFKTGSSDAVIYRFLLNAANAVGAVVLDYPSLSIASPTVLRALRTVIAGDLSAGSVSVVAQWKNNAAGTINLVNSANGVGVLTILNVGP